MTWKDHLKTAAHFERLGLVIEADKHRDLAAERLRGVFPPLASQDEIEPAPLGPAFAVFFAAFMFFVGLGFAAWTYWGVIHPHNAARVEADD